MSAAVLFVCDGRDFLAAQAWADRSDLDRALRRYFLRASEARRMLRCGRTGAAGLAATAIEADAIALDDRKGPFTPLVRRCFCAVDALLAALDARPSPPQGEDLVTRLNAADRALRAPRPTGGDAA